MQKLIQALAGKVIGTAAGGIHTVVWTDAGELLTFGCGQLGHGGTPTESVPRLIEALAGKKVVDAAAGTCIEHTVA